MSRLVKEPAGQELVSPDPASVHDRHVGAEPLPHDVGDEVAHVGLARPERRVARVQRHPGLADPDVERGAELGLVPRDQRRHRRVLRQLGRDRDEAVLASQDLAVAGRLEVDAHDEDPIRSCLGDQRVPDDVLERVVLVAPEDEVDAGHRARHLLVGRHVLMRDRHHDRAAARPKLGHGHSGSGNGIAELDSRTGLDVCGVSATVRPKKPTWTPPRSITCVGRAPPNGRPVARSSTFDDTHAKRDSRIRASRVGAPKSNSWFPNVATSSPS